MTTTTKIERFQEKKKIEEFMKSDERKKYIKRSLPYTHTYNIHCPVFYCDGDCVKEKECLCKVHSRRSPDHCNIAPIVSIFFRMCTQYKYSGRELTKIIKITDNEIIGFVEYFGWSYKVKYIINEKF